MKSVNGFDTQIYLTNQTEKIQERLSHFHHKLYLEFGGKLLYDGHAQRVLFGYEPNAKTQLLKKLKHLEVIYCISAKDIQRGRVLYDSGLTYELQALQNISDIRAQGFNVSAIVISRYENEPLALRFKKMLENSGNNVYVHTEIKGYPKDLKKLLGKEGFAKQPYIKTTAPLVVVTGVGGGSGKMSVCLSQLYHDQKKGLDTGYSKFETFPIWNLPLQHPVNLAYEAATADLGDVNLIDPYHWKKYKIKAVNYNRDIENFAILKKIMKAITHKDNFINSYNSPTDMGVNMAKTAIVDDAVVQKCAKEEIIRRYFRYKEEILMGRENEQTLANILKVMKTAKVKESDYPLVLAARQAREAAEKRKEGNEGIYCGAAIELSDGRIISGHNSPLLHAESAVIIKTLKEIAGIPKEQKLLSEKILEQMLFYKREIGYSSVSLNAEETLTLLGIVALFEPLVKKVIAVLPQLKNANIHITHIPKQGDEEGLKKLRLNVTTDGELGLQNFFKK